MNKKRQMSAVYHYSYIQLALNYYGFYETISEKPEISEELSASVKELNEVISGFLNGQGDLSKAEALRSHNMHNMEIITSYIEGFQIYEFVLNRMEKKFRDGPTVRINLKKVEDDIMVCLKSFKEEAPRQEMIRALLGELPVRLTKAKFYSMVKDSIALCAGSQKQSLDELLYILRTGSMLKLPEHTEKGYEMLSDLLNQLKETDYKNMTDVTFEASMDKISAASKKLMGLVEDYMTLQDMANSLYLLCLSESETLIDAEEKQTVSEIVTGILNQFQADEKSPMDSEITDMLPLLEGKQESLNDLLLGAELPDPIDKLMSDSTFVDINKQFSSEIADITWVNAQVDQYIADLDALFKEIPKPVVRAVMARVLAGVPIAFTTPMDIRAYVKCSLESCTDWAERQTCIEILKGLMKHEYSVV